MKHLTTEQTALIEEMKSKFSELNNRSNDGSMYARMMEQLAAENKAEEELQIKKQMLYCYTLNLVEEIKEYIKTETRGLVWVEVVRDEFMQYGVLRFKIVSANSSYQISPSIQWYDDKGGCIRMGLVSHCMHDVSMELFKEKYNIEVEKILFIELKKAHK